MPIFIQNHVFRPFFQDIAYGPTEIRRYCTYSISFCSPVCFFHQPVSSAVWTSKVVLVVFFDVILVSEWPIIAVIQVGHRLTIIPAIVQFVRHSPVVYDSIVISISKAISTKCNVSYIGVLSINRKELKHCIVVLDADANWFCEVALYLEQHDFAFTRRQTALCTNRHQVVLCLNAYSNWMAISTTFRSRYRKGLDDLQCLWVHDQDLFGLRLWNIKMTFGVVHRIGIRKLVAVRLHKLNWNKSQISYNVEEVLLTLSSVLGSRIFNKRFTELLVFGVCGLWPPSADLRHRAVVRCFIIFILHGGCKDNRRIAIFLVSKYFPYECPCQFRSFFNRFSISDLDVEVMGDQSLICD